MNKIVIIYADEGKEWGKFLAKEIENFGEVNQYCVDALDSNTLISLDSDLVCVILSPVMLEKKKKFIQKSASYFADPVIVLCGVTTQNMNETVHCNSWKRCQQFTVTSDTRSTDNFKNLVGERLQDLNINDIKLIPDTIIEKVNQSCVLIFSKSFLCEVEVLIPSCSSKLIAKKVDSKSYTIDVSGLPEGHHTMFILVAKRKIPGIFSLTVVSAKPKCGCKYINEILDSKDFQPLDKTLASSMENDYSNRRFYQNISNRNPEIPEYPTPLHFAAAHGMSNVLQYLLTISGAKNGLTLKNDKNMDCLDIAKSTRHSSLISILDKHMEEDAYLDMSQISPYVKMMANRRSSVDRM